MKQHRRPRWVSSFGLFMVGSFLAGVAQYGGATSAPAADTAIGTTVLERPIYLAQAETTAPSAEAAPASPEQLPAEPSGEATADETVAEEPAVEEVEDRCCKKGDKTPPFELIANTPPGELNNPYDWKLLAEENSDDPDYLAKQYLLPGCGECHGNAGGGSFCPALNQGAWLWGNTDDVLFRLIALGSVELEKQGWQRYQFGTVKAPMPEMGQVIKTSDHLWRIIAYIRSISPPGSSPPEKVMPGKYTAPVQEAQPQ